MTLLENDRNKVPEIMALLFPKLGKALRLGITGPPGAGKSTLVDQLIKLLRQKNKRIGVIAVDPSSPFSGGAVLGDRIRMERHYEDEGVFIRSMGSRGSGGGLSLATSTVVQLYDAFGMDVVIIESVGVGQTELDIMHLASTTAVVLVPESGDTIQTMKAGIMEIADIFVVNKADRPGADLLAQDLIFLAGQYQKEKGWHIPVLLTSAIKNKGMNEFYQAVQQHHDWIKKQTADAEKEARNYVRPLFQSIMHRLESDVKATFEHKSVYQKLLKEVHTKKTNPYEAYLKISEKWPEFLKDLTAEPP